MAESKAIQSPTGVSILPILAVNFVGTLGFSIVLPFLVFLVTRWGGNAFIFGLMGATYSIFQLIGAPILGRWSDHYGRKKILLLSQLGTLVSWMIFLVAFIVPENELKQVQSASMGQFAITLPLIIMFIARAADGITGGNVSVANAYLADITDDDNRSANFGKMALSGNIGFVLGPALAGLLGATMYGELLPVLAATLISLGATFIIAFGLKEHDPSTIESAPPRHSVRKVFGQENKECYEVQDAERAGFFDIVGMEHVARMLAIYFLVMLGFSFFYIGFPVHAANVLQWSVTETGTFFAVLSLLMVIVQGPVLDRMSKRLSERSLIVGGTVILCGGFACLYFEDSVIIYLGAALIALGNGLMWPSVMAMLSIVAGDEHQGAIQGAGGSVSAVASIIGLIAGGLLYNWLGAWVFVLSTAVFLPVVVITPHVSGARTAGTKPT